jgi:hypothetical protein
MLGRGMNMTRGRCRSASLDDGVTIVEIVMSLTILLFALTAILGLMTSATMSTRLAKQRAAMINAGSSYMERVRQTSWISVGTPGGDPEGDLATQTVSIDGFEITISPEVSWGRSEEPTSHSYKTVAVRISSQFNPDGRVMGWVMSTVVNEWGLGTNPASARFIGPPGGTVVWTPGVDIGVEGATNSPSRDLVSCSLWDEGNISNPSTLIGSELMVGRSDVATFTWEVTSATREGWHRISAHVVDNGPTQANSDGLMLLVDNVAPTWPTGATVTSPQASSASASFFWTPAVDGTDTDWTTPAEADHYAVDLRQQPLSANPNDYLLWPVAQSNTKLMSPAPTSTVPLEISGLYDFSRYALVVGASSPDRSGGAGLESASKIVGTSVTSSMLSGTWTVTREMDGDWQVDVVAGIPSGPRFPWTGTARTSYYMTSSTENTTTPSGTFLGAVDSTYPVWSTTTVTLGVHTEHDHPAPPPFYVAAWTTITPTGYAGTTTVVRSCVIGPPADPTLSGTQAMLVVTP